MQGTPKRDVENPWGAQTKVHPFYLSRTFRGIDKEAAGDYEAVAKRMQSPEIKAAIEALFQVNVTAVNTLVRKGKMKRFRGRPGRQSDVKHAVVTLKDGQSIDVTTGL